MSWTRRAFLGVAAAAALPVAACSNDGGTKPAAGPAATPGRTPAVHRRVIPENELEGDPRWWITKLGAPHEIQGYAGQASVLPGEPVHLYVSTTAREFQATAFRVGWYRADLARKVWRSRPVRGHRQAAAGFAGHTRTVHTSWGVTLTVPTDDWPPGAYLIRLDADNGAQRYVPLTVRSASTAGKVVLKQAVPTWQAYNTWGNYDLYIGPGGYADRSYVVSLDRPGDYDGAYLFMVYERKLVNLAERLGLPLAYLTSMDIARDPRSLDGASALISPGHDEYWSPHERSVVTAARDRGTNLAFLGANAMFRRTRLAPSPLGPDRQIICYKTSYNLDPMFGVHDDLVTSDWREPPHPEPESSLIGTMYEGYPALSDFVVHSPHAWMFRGTGVRAGSTFRNLIGVEYDRVTPGFPVERPMEVLSHSPLVCKGVHSFADSAYYTHQGGAGVFNTGTMRWVETFAAPTYHWGISRATMRFTRHVTSNVLRAFAEGPAAHKYPARDNLASVHEHVGDPVGTEGAVTAQ
jgi:hypothetical protein